MFLIYHGLNQRYSFFFLCHFPVIVDLWSKFIALPIMGDHYKFKKFEDESIECLETFRGKISEKIINRSKRRGEK